VTPARAHLESIVDSLRRKQVVAIATTAFVEMVLVGAVIYALLRIGLPNILLTKPRRLVLAAALLLVFFAALLVEQARQARSALYLAKQIDTDNELDDHLVSALSFADPPSNGYEQMCVNTLIVRLQQMRLRIPEVRLERLWLLLPALVVAGATTAVEYTRRQRPEDDGALKIVLPPSVADALPLISDAEASARKLDPELVRRSNEMHNMISELVQRSASKESVLRDLSTAREAFGKYQADNPNVIDAAMQLGDPSTQRAQKLLGAVRSGKAASITTALQEIADAISGKKPPPLSDDERREVAAILDALAQATHAAQLAKGMRDAATSLRRDTGAEAAASLDKLKAPLAEEMDRATAIRQLESQIRVALAETGRKAEIAAYQLKKLDLKQQPSGAAPTTDGGALALGGTAGGINSPDDPNDVGGTGGTAAGGAGAGSASEPETGGGTPETPTTDVDVRAAGVWTAAPVRQLVQAGASNDKGAQAGARAILNIQQRQLEGEIRREEIPAEYAAPIRRYFSNLQRAWEQNKWTPNK
jgi:hypothetical protein